MTETVADMGSLEKTIKKAASPADAERAVIRELVIAARARGEDLTGPDGFLKLVTKTVLETALEEELNEHLIGQLGMTSTRSRGATARTPATVGGPRPWSPTPWGRWRSRSRGTGTAPSLR
jgi:hypothetical protein